MSKVTWLDAVQKKITSEALTEIIKAKEFISGKDMLAINTTYGMVHEFKEVVLIITEESTDGDTEVIIIPKDWVISIK